MEVRYQLGTAKIALYYLSLGWQNREVDEIIRICGLGPVAPVVHDLVRLIRVGLDRRRCDDRKQKLKRQSKLDRFVVDKFLVRYTFVLGFKTRVS